MHTVKHRLLLSSFLLSLFTACGSPSSGSGGSGGEGAGGSGAGGSGTGGTTTSTGGTGGTGGPAVNTKSPLGTNLWGMTAYEVESSLVNRAAYALEWMPVGGIAWEASVPAANLDANGYLKAGSSGELPIYWDTPRSISGDYVVTYTGTGTVTLHNNGGNGTVTVASSTPGRIELTLTDVNFLFARVENGANDPVQNLRVVEKRFDGKSDVFYPEYIANWNRFKVLRFMDLMRTNTNTFKHWAEYPTSAHLQQSNALAPDYIAELCNETHTDAWINIPVEADDDFVTQFATVMKDKLDPSLRAYVEYSNENWNSSFKQSKYVAAKGKAAAEWSGLPDWEAGGHYVGRRAGQIFDIFANVYGSELSSRVKRVVAWQVGAGGYWHDLVLGTDDVYKKTDAYAVAPYFGWDFGTGGMSNATSVDDIFDRLIPAELADTKDRVQTDFDDLKGDPRFAGIPLITYEGGQSLIGNDGTQQGYAKEANRDPRMGGVYTQFLTDLSSVGNGDVFFMNFSSCVIYSQYGSWGLKEFPEQTRAQAPKYDAALTWIEGHPVVWNGGATFSP